MRHFFLMLLITLAPLAHARVVWVRPSGAASYPAIKIRVIQPGQLTTDCREAGARVAFYECRSQTDCDLLANEAGTPLLFSRSLVVTKEEEFIDEVVGQTLGFGMMAIEAVVQLLLQRPIEDVAERRIAIGRISEVFGCARRAIDEVGLRECHATGPNENLTLNFYNGVRYFSEPTSRRLRSCELRPAYNIY